MNEERDDNEKGEDKHPYQLTEKQAVIWTSIIIVGVGILTLFINYCSK